MTTCHYAWTEAILGTMADNAGAAKAEAIGFVSAHRGDYPRQRDEIFPELLRAAEEHGYRLEKFFLEDYPENGALERELQQHGITGIIALATADAKLYKRFAWKHFSVVQVLTGQEPYLVLPVVRPDPFSTLLDAGQRVIRAKARSAIIVLVQAPGTISLTDLRYQAAASLVQQMWEEEGIGDRRLMTIKAHDDEGCRDFAALIKDDLPEVLVSQNTMMNWALLELGIRMPEDLKFIALSMPKDAAFAGYRQCTAEIADAAVEMLEEFLHTDTKPPLAIPKVKVVPDQWIPGPTFPENP